MLSVLFIASLPDLSRGQSMNGLIMSNYAGVNSIQVNPSAMLSSKNWLEIHLVGVGVFVQNNMLYQEGADYKFSHFFQIGYEWPTHSEGFGTESRIFYTFDNKRPKLSLIHI